MVVIKDGLVVYDIHRNRMRIAAIELCDECPCKDELSTLQDRHPGKRVCRAPKILVNAHIREQFNENLSATIGKLEVCLANGNWEKAHEVLRAAQRGGSSGKAIDTSCADLGLPERDLSTLESHNIIFVWQLLYLQRDDLLRMTNVGELTATRIQQKVKDFCLGLHSTGEWNEFVLAAGERIDKVGGNDSSKKERPPVGAIRPQVSRSC
jgi:hypothetical protein